MKGPRAVEVKEDLQLETRQPVAALGSSLQGSPSLTKALLAERRQGCSLSTLLGRHSPRERHLDRKNMQCLLPHIFLSA